MQSPSVDQLSLVGTPQIPTVVADWLDAQIAERLEWVGRSIRTVTNGDSSVAFFDSADATASAGNHKGQGNALPAKTADAIYSIYCRFTNTPATATIADIRAILDGGFFSLSLNERVKYEDSLIRLAAGGGLYSEQGGVAAATQNFNIGAPSIAAAAVFSVPIWLMPLQQFDFRVNFPGGVTLGANTGLEIAYRSIRFRAATSSG